MTTAGPRPVTDRVAVAAILLLSLVSYGPGLWPGRVRAPSEILEGFAPWRAPEGPAKTTDPVLADLTSQFHPWLIHAAREVRHGRLPLWNPDAYCGHPFVGSMQTGVFSPFTALAYVLPVAFAIGLAAVAQAAVAGLSMYWFLRLLAVPPLAGLLGAMAFMFNGFLAGWMGWSLAASGAWTPALFAGLELVRQDGRWRSAVPLALATAGLILGGHPETAFHAGCVVAAYALMLAWRADGRFLLLAGAGFGTGLLLAAVQILPFLEYLPYTQTFQCRTQGGLLAVLPLKWALLLLMPRYFGHPGVGTAWDPDFSSNYTEVSGTVGLVPLLLLPAAVAGMRRARAPFFLALAALVFPCVYELPGLPFGPALLHVPGFAVSVNHRLLLILAFALSVLGAFGMERLISEGVSPRLRRATTLWAAALAVVLLASTLADRPLMEAAHAWTRVGARILLSVALIGATALALRRMAARQGTVGAALLLLGIEAASVVPFASTYCPVVARNRFYPKTPGLEYLASHAGRSRVMMPLTNLLQVWDLAEPGGYDAMNPAVISDLLGAPPAAGTPCNALVTWRRAWDSPAFGLLGVRYVLMPPGSAKPGTRFRLVQDGPDGRVWESLAAFPRSFLVPRAVRFAAREEELAAIVAGRVDLRRTVSLLAGDDDPAPPGTAGPDGLAEIVGYEAGRVEIRTTSSHPAYLVLSDAFFPGWRASVDGSPVRILRADYAFRAVRVPAGTHEAVFRYAPASFRIGAGLSLLGLLLVGLALVRRP